MRRRDEELFEARCHLAALERETTECEVVILSGSVTLSGLGRVFTGRCKRASELGGALGFPTHTYSALAAGVVPHTNRAPEGARLRKGRET